MTGKVREAISHAAARFGFSETPRLDAELLMAHALGCTREALLLGRLDDPAPDGFAALVERRAAHEPVAYITEVRAFWTIELAVGPGVLVPRADTETLMEAAVEHFGERSPRAVLDLGTGSGALLLAALDQWPEAGGVGVDRSPQALAVARYNARLLGVEARARFVEGGWDAVEGTFDLVLSNPPYIADTEELAREVAEYEPASALYAGPDGLDEYRALAPIIARRIAPGGVACIEIGSSQGESAAAPFRAEGLTVDLRQDLGGRDRCLVATP
ncbi:peptide chain release factor N(5)-glutamine methyltransferase [Sphingomonas lenta]|uniref:Release factor glutamine methyltransferase n=1 Tax=Sphingomonas lenta TaxID=1141887 RepID=A0A2A2SCE8_9SPHN|nr:peptide chain release factor N(5)-glutamine methyltransferase [Sphingomonas lenta]PAX06936.1 protein-(glutamine-N5) methyltransferase, release factor-specific [Sphingomonas lenta]